MLSIWTSPEFCSLVELKIFTNHSLKFSLSFLQDLVDLKATTSDWYQGLANQKFCYFKILLNTDKSGEYRHMCYDEWVLNLQFRNFMGECNTILSPYTMYRHLE